MHGDPVSDEAKPGTGPAEAGVGDFVQSLERGLSVIRAFDADHPKLSLSEVASATGMSRAAARRFLHTLQQVQSAYPDARFESDEKGVTLHHSRPPVTKSQQAFLLE